MDGLSILYTGSAGGTDAGKIKLTFGVAELYDRALFGITDSMDGYVANKEQSLQNEMNGYDTQVSDMTARLNRKREMMTNSFVAMEMAMQKIQNQSSWLTGQVEAASNGWYKG